LRAFLGATIVHGEHLHCVDCIVRDASDTGVKISIPPLTVLPDRFWLLDHRLAVAHEARLAWRRGNFAGLEFVGRRALHGSADPAVGVLRRIWLEKAPRAGVY
jgi:hypothetical protein